MARWNEDRQHWQHDNNGDGSEDNTNGSGNDSDSTWTGITPFGEFLNKVASPVVSRFSFYMSKIAGRSEGQPNQRTLTSDSQPSYSEPKLDGGNMEQVRADWQRHEQNMRLQEGRRREVGDDENLVEPGPLSILFAGGFHDFFNRLEQTGLVDVDPAQSFSPLSTAMLKTLGIETPNKANGAMVGA